MKHSIAHHRRTAIGAIATGFLTASLLALPLQSHAAGPVRVTLSTSAGDIRLELYPNHAPKTVANFVQYVKDKHYDGTVFHRVINGFMVQGGVLMPLCPEAHPRARAT